MPFDPYDPLTGSADALMGQTLAARMAPAGPVFPLPNTGAQTDALPMPSTSYVGEVGNPPPVADGPMVPGALAGMPTGLPTAPAAIRQPAPQEPTYDPRGEMSRMGMNMVRYGTPAERLQGLQMMQQALLPNEEEKAARERERLMHVIDIAPVDDATKQRAAIGLHLGQKPEDLMKTMGLDQPNLFGGAAQAGAATGPQGEDFLKTLPPVIANQVKALADGRMQFPSRSALKTPYWEQMIQAVSQYDPTFDAVNYATRAATRKAFTSGKEGRDLNALNTAMQHLGTLSNAGEDLNNTDMPLVNRVANAYVTEAKGDPRVVNFNTARDKVAEEFTRLYRGAGGSESDIKREIENLNAANSPAQLRAAIATMADLARSKAQSLADQYNQGMGTTKDPLELVHPKARAVFETVSARAAGAHLNGAPARVVNDAEYEALPSGAAFIGPDGKVRRKP